MKSHFKNIFLFVLLLFCSTISIAQTVFEGNLQKYWYYRERLKNFVVVGDGVGCGLISNALSTTTISYGDHTQILGNYISMLAMEHYLLRTNSQDLSENTKELHYAIEAFNRLDKMAETYWCSTSKFGNYNFTGYVPNPQNDLNGYFIRDDTPYNLLDYNYNSMLMENHLGNHWAPLNDGYRKMLVDGSFTEKEYTKNADAYKGGPADMSLDQVIELTVGLELTAKFVDPNLAYGPPFSDSETKIVQEVKNICKRLSNRVRANAWVIRNPVTGNCVTGTNITNGCLESGAIFKDLSKGYAIANGLIEDDFIPNGLYYSLNYGFDQTVNGVSTTFWNNYKYFPHFKKFEETKVILLAAMSNIWGNETMGIVADRSYQNYRADRINFPHYPLLHAVLFNKQNPIPNSVYECMLNSAQKNGQWRGELNYEWAGQRLIYGPNDNQTTFATDMEWGEYMYYFNMYCIYNPSYMQNAYRKIPPNELAELDVIKTGNGSPNSPYKEWDWKKFDAVNSISAGNINNQGNYIIKKYDGVQQAGNSLMCDKDNIGNYVPSLPINGNTDSNAGEFQCSYDQVEATDATKVFFKAGEIVQLLPGFEVHAGAELDAWTETGMKEYQGKESMTCIACSNCKPTGNEEIGIGFRDKSDAKLYKVYSFVPGELFVVTPHVIFKIRGDGSVGENMFGIKETNVANCPNDYEVNNGGNGNHVLAGYQRFKDGGIGNHGIVDLDYYQGFTFVSFADGRMLRIKGTGGEGKDMFGVSDDNANRSITLISNAANYGQAYYKFSHPIFDVKVVDNNLLVALNRLSFGGLGENSVLLKFTNVGTAPYQGSSHPMIQNFFQMNTPTNYNQAQGYATFKGKITCVKYLDGKLFVATKNNGTAKGKLLKVNGSGGTGENMFAIEEGSFGDTWAFRSLPNYNYYSGDELFGFNTGSNAGSYITEMYTVSGSTFASLKNGKVMRISNTGGTGHHMFNIDEYNTSFVNHSNNSTHYLLSYQDFSGGSGAALNDEYVRVMEVIGDELFMGFHDGMLRKYDLIATPALNGNIAPETGFSNLRTSVVSITKLSTGCAGNGEPFEPRGGGGTWTGGNVNNGECDCYYKVFIGLAGDNIVCAKNAGNGGGNFYGLSWRETPTIVSGVATGLQQDQSAYTSLCGNKWYVGSGNFKSICAGARLSSNDEKEETPLLSEDEYLLMAEKTTIVNSYEYSYLHFIKISPNPTAGEFNLQINSTSDLMFTIQISDLSGKVLQQFNMPTNTEKQVDSKLQSGIYFIRAIAIEGNISLTEKLIIQ